MNRMLLLALLSLAVAIPVACGAKATCYELNTCGGNEDERPKRYCDGVFRYPDGRICEACAKRGTDGVWRFPTGHVWTGNSPEYCPDAGAGGVENAGGLPNSSAGTGGMLSVGGAAGAMQAGAGGSAPLPCNGLCAKPTSVCDEATQACVGCLGSDDCGGATPLCDLKTKTCVACLQNTDCTDPKASRCDAGTCEPCLDGQSDSCAHITGANVCNTGECVQCTGTDYSACGIDTKSGKPRVCDSLTRTCTLHDERSAGLCIPCVSDAHCAKGQLCVLQRYAGKEVGHFCHWRKGDSSNGAPNICGTARPYVATLAAKSIDGTSADVCSLRTSTCTAKGQFSSKDCTSGSGPADAQCGFDPTKDSKCVQFDEGLFRCTMTCGSDDDCPAPFGCDTGKSPQVCKLTP